MTSKLGGKAVRTLITSLEVLSNDEQSVLMIDRQEDGSIVLKTRKVYENAWSSNGPRFEIEAKDARTLSYLMRSEDARYMEHVLEEIEVKDFSGPEPEDVVEARLREKIGDCSELD